MSDKTEKENTEHLLENEPKDPEFNGEVVKKESSGFLSSIFGQNSVDCDKLLANMKKCVAEKDGTTMCREQVDEWEKIGRAHV